MELRIYGKIIWRYIWLIVVVVGIVTVYAGYQYHKLPKVSSFTSGISIQIGLAASNKVTITPDDNVNVAGTLADTLVSGSLLSSQAFSSDIAHQVAQDGSQIQQRYGTNPDLGDIQNVTAIASSLSAQRADVLVIVSVNWSTPAGAWAIANAVGEISTSHIGRYLDYVITNDYTHASSNVNASEPEVSARVISAALLSKAAPVSSSSKLTQIALLPIIALIVGIALAFLLNYLDDRVYREEDVVDLLLVPVLGEVPQAPVPGHARLSGMHKSQAN